MYGKASKSVRQGVRQGFVQHNNAAMVALSFVSMSNDTKCSRTPCFLHSFSVSATRSRSFPLLHTKYKWNEVQIGFLLCVSFDSVRYVRFEPTLIGRFCCQYCVCRRFLQNISVLDPVCYCYYYYDYYYIFGVYVLLLIVCSSWYTQSTASFTQGVRCTRQLYRFECTVHTRFIV